MTGPVNAALGALVLATGILAAGLWLLLGYAIAFWPLTLALAIIALALWGWPGWALLIVLCLLAVLCAYLFAYLVSPS